MTPAAPATLRAESKLRTAATCFVKYTHRRENFAAPASVSIKAVSARAPRGFARFAFNQSPGHADISIEHEFLRSDRPGDEAQARSAHPKVAQQHERLRLARLPRRWPRGELDRIAIPQDADQPGHFPARGRPPRDRFREIQKAL